MPSERPRLAITMGDPAGVGPELCLRLLSVREVQACCTPLIFGDAAVLRRVGRRLALSVPRAVVDSLDELGTTVQPAILDLGGGEPVEPGVISSSTGQAAFDFVDAAVGAALSGSVDAVVTGPIHKEAFHMAGVPYPGHTELLAAKTGSERVCMMLTSDEISCSVVTAHIGFRQIIPSLKTERIFDAIELSHQAMRRLRNREVRLTVCGLNPHAGEHGLFGDREEERLIVPAIEQARQKGMAVVGPLPADTAFVPAIRATTDCYICMYHDQGLIPLKALAFDTAVNVTLGLPIIRTSVDHGTALDIAWQGKASVGSLVEASLLAARLASAPAEDAAAG